MVESPLGLEDFFNDKGKKSLKASNIFVKDVKKKLMITKITYRRNRYEK